MRHVHRVLITVLAVIGVVFSGVAFAQEDDPVAERAECLAQGGEWFVNPSGRFCEIDGVTHTIFDAYADLEDPAAEPAPAEPAPSAQLPQTAPAPAQQGAPQYTG